MKPTASVINICLETERCFQRMLKSTGGKLPQTKGLPDAIASSVLCNINKADTFPELDEHMLDTTVDDNHTFTQMLQRSLILSSWEIHYRTAI